MAHPFSIGLIGTGRISAQFCDACRASGRMRPAAILSRSRESGTRFAAAHAIAGVFTDPTAFYKSGLDAVYIASPNYAHAAQAEAALHAGLPVLVEKPATLTRASFRSLMQLAQEKHLPLMEGMRPLYDPCFSLIRQALPQLGRLRQVRLEYCQYSSRYHAYLSGDIQNAFQPSLGNAALMDIGVYCAALCAALFGPPAHVQAHSIFLPNGFEGCGEALLHYGDYTVSLVYSKITESASPSSLTGENGNLLIEGHCNAPRRLILSLRGQEPIALPYVPAENNMIYEVEAFASLLRAGQYDYPGLAVTDTQMAILDAIRQEAGICFA